MGRWWRRLGTQVWFSASALVASGCLPILYATPPVRGQVGVGLDAVQPSSEESTQLGGHFDMRGSIAPLQLPEQLADRPLDVGVGYGLTLPFGQTRQLLHGPYLEFGVLQPVQDNFRFGFTGQVHGLLTPAEGEPRQAFFDGARGALQAHIEWSGYTEGPTQSCQISSDGGFCGSGLALGDAGIGFYAEVAATRVLLERNLAFTVGLTFRAPASVGFGFIFPNWVDLLF